MKNNIKKLIKKLTPNQMLPLYVCFDINMRYGCPFKFIVDISDIITRHLSDNLYDFDIRNMLLIDKELYNKIEKNLFDSVIIK